MPKKNKSCIITVILVAVAALVLLVLLFVNFTLPNFLDFKKALIAPPTIVVYSPIQGEQAPEGSIISSRATATGTNPIARIELWMDGEMVTQQLPSGEMPLNLTTMHATVPIKITVGTHMLYWRAVDNVGQIGQSPPITIIGTDRLGGNETTIVVAEEGQTLQEIAEAQGGEPDVLHDLNPGLGGTGLPGGTNVKVPVPAAPGEAQPPSGGDILVDPPQGGSIIVTNVQTLMPADPIINFGLIISVLASSLPAAPIDLQVGFENCFVQLVWTDNADNEQNYNIWMQAGGGPPTMISTLGPRSGTGPAEYKFVSPTFGIYRFWVEATNGLGAQPSQVEWLFINDSTCGEILATRLEVEILDINTGGFSGQMYCYVSLEGNPEKRIPETNFFNDFVNILFGDYFNLEGTGTVFLIPIPADEEVTLEGKCLGNTGTDVIEFGTFSKSVPRAQWDGSRHEAQAGNVVIGFRIQPHGSMTAKGAYRFSDNDLLIPWIIKVETKTDRDPEKRARLARNITLVWDWDGDLDEITNFVIALDDMKEYLVVGKETSVGKDREPWELWEMPISLPSSCGGIYKFAVAAVAKGGAMSGYSTYYSYEQPPCDFYAEVIFDTFVLTYFDDNEYLPPHLDCDVAELGFEIEVSSVNRVWRNWDGGLRWHYYGTSTNCNQSYHFTQYPFNKGAPGKRDSFTVLIEPSTSTIGISVRFADLDNFIVAWDTDNICWYNQTLFMPQDEWAGYYEGFSETCQEAWFGEQDGKVQINYRVRGYSTPH